MLDALFLEWPILKVRYQGKILVFLTGAECVIVGDDAMVAVEAMDDADNLVFTPEGCYWKCNVAHKAFFLRKLEQMGHPIKYLRAQTRAEKVRLDSQGNPERRICQNTGRVYVGESGLGTFWYDGKERAVYMMDNCHKWLGMYCVSEDWSAQKLHCKVHQSLPGAEEEFVPRIAIVE